MFNYCYHVKYWTKKEKIDFQEKNQTCFMAEWYPQEAHQYGRFGEMYKL